MRKPEIEAIYLTTQEEEDAIYEGKVKKFCQQKAIKNGVSWDTKHKDFGVKKQWKNANPILLIKDEMDEYLNQTIKP